MLLKEWRKCRDAFKRPKVMVYFGFWGMPWFIGKIGKYLMESFKNEDLKNTRKYKIYRWIFDHVKRTCDPGLPVWRRGNNINLFRKHWQFDYQDQKHYIKWQSDFKEKLDKWHLGWLKPQYTLPSQLACYIFNIDMMWKWKYDDVRHEFNPQLTFVFFNIALSFFWVAPYRPESTYDLYYWESILNYNYQLPDELKDNSTLEKLKWVNDSMGAWIRTEKNEQGNEVKTKIWNVQPDFLKDKAIAEEIRKYQKEKE